MLQEAELLKSIDGNSDDPLYKALITYLSTATDTQRRAFVRFTTSSPQLPVGGLRYLKPKLSVLTNHTPTWAKETVVEANSVPLSTSTCEHILRIPQYDSDDVTNCSLTMRLHD